MNAQSLVDDQGTPIRWKFATVLAVAAFLITLAIAIANAGAKSERLEATAKRVEKLEAVVSKVDRLESWKEDVSRRLGDIEAGNKEILREVRRR
jgi:hypothetical protein